MFRTHLIALTTTLSIAISAVADVSAGDFITDGGKIEIDLPPDPGELVEFELPIGGTAYHVRLRRHSVRSPNFRMFIDRGGGAIEEVDPEPSKTYRGSIDGLAGARVVGSVDDGFTGFIFIDDGREQTWSISPLGDGSGASGGSAHLLEVRRGDVDPAEQSGQQCGAAEGGSPVEGGILYCAEVAYDADYEFVVEAGSPPAAVDAIELRHSLLAFIYDRDAGVRLEISAIVIHDTSDDPYFAVGNPCDVLAEFRTVWETAYADVPRDLAMLITARSLGIDPWGFTYGGEAYGSGDSVCGIEGATVCTDHAYGVAQVLTAYCLDENVAKIGHQIGHIFGAHHYETVPPNIMARVPGFLCPNLSIFDDAADTIAWYAEQAECVDAGCIIGDCNQNGIEDDLDLASGFSLDCNLNGVPDECDIDPADPDEDGWISPDCNGNLVPDECDIAFGTSEDCLGNGVPDECEELVPAGPPWIEALFSLEGSSSEVGWSWSLSTLGCELAMAPSVAPVPFGAPAIQIAERFAESINAQGLGEDRLFAEAVMQFGTTFLYIRAGGNTASALDLCVGTANGEPNCCPQFLINDCDFNPHMEEVFPLSPIIDCNGNGRHDLIDIVLYGSSCDLNSNGVPDECECPGDLDANGTVDFSDLLQVLAAWGDCDETCCEDIVPMGGDGTVGFAELLIVLSSWGPCD